MDYHTNKSVSKSQTNTSVSKSILLQPTPVSNDLQNNISKLDASYFWTISHMNSYTSG